MNNKHNDRHKRGSRWPFKENSRIWLIENHKCITHHIYNIPYIYNYIVSNNNEALTKAHRYSTQSVSLSFIYIYIYCLICIINNETYTCVRRWSALTHIQYVKRSCVVWRAHVCMRIKCSPLPLMLFVCNVFIGYLRDVMCLYGCMCDYLRCDWSHTYIKQRW